MKLDDILFFGLRHATTGGNTKGTYRGWSNGPDAQLNAQGRREAEEAGRYLAAIGASIEIFVTDSLDRVVETVEIASQFFPNARIETVRGLHPLNVGDWTGKSKKEHPVEPYLKETGKKIPGGESLDDFNQRQVEVFQDIFELIKSFRGGKLAVGLHGSNTAYLHNHVFNKSAAKVGYEGIVDPGGLYAVTAAGIVPLTRARDKNSKPVQQGSEALALYPPDHQAGMQVPKGGSMCANCKYLDEDKKSCTKENFIRWNGSEVIPGKIDEYCSDWYEPKEKL